MTSAIIHDKNRWKSSQTTETLGTNYASSQCYAKYCRHGCQPALAVNRLQTYYLRQRADSMGKLSTMVFSHYLESPGFFPCRWKKLFKESFKIGLHAWWKVKYKLLPHLSTENTMSLHVRTYKINIKFIIILAYSYTIMLTALLHVTLMLGD